MNPHLLTALLLLAAAAAYLLGMAVGGAILIALGMILELIFWVRVLVPAARKRTGPDR